MIPPLRTAATTAALRRTTHLLVFGWWQLLHKPRPGHRTHREAFSFRRRPAALGRCLAPAGPARNRTGRKDSCMLAGSLFYDPAFSSGTIPVRFTIFSRLRACCHQFFRLFESGASVRKWRCLKAGQIQRSGRIRRARLMPKRERPRRKFSGFTVFSRSDVSFFTFVLALGANFTLV